MTFWLLLPSGVTASLLGSWLRRKDIVNLVDSGNYLELSEALKLYVFSTRNKHCIAKFQEQFYSAKEVHWYYARCGVTMPLAVKLLGRPMSKPSNTKFTRMPLTKSITKCDDCNNQDQQLLFACNVLIIQEHDVNVRDLLHILPKLKNLTFVQIATDSIQRQDDLVTLLTLTRSRCSILVDSAVYGL